MLLERFTSFKPNFHHWVIGKGPVRHAIFTVGQSVCTFSYQASLSHVGNLEKKKGGPLPLPCGSEHKTGEGALSPSILASLDWQLFRGKVSPQ